MNTSFELLGHKFYNDFIGHYKSDTCNLIIILYAHMSGIFTCWLGISEDINDNEPLAEFTIKSIQDIIEKQDEIIKVITVYKQTANNKVKKADKILKGLDILI